MRKFWRSTTLTSCRLAAGPEEFDVGPDGVLDPAPGPAAERVLRQLPHLYEQVDEPAPQEPPATAPVPAPEAPSPALTPQASPQPAPKTKPKR